jgi:hypothetical protein
MLTYFYVNIFFTSQKLAKLQLKTIKRVRGHKQNIFLLNRLIKQAGAELLQAQAMLC